MWRPLLASQWFDKHLRNKQCMRILAPGVSNLAAITIVPRDVPQDGMRNAHPPVDALASRSIHTCPWSAHYNKLVTDCHHISTGMESHQPDICSLQSLGVWSIPCRENNSVGSALLCIRGTNACGAAVALFNGTMSMHAYLFTTHRYWGIPAWHSQHLVAMWGSKLTYQNTLSQLRVDGSAFCRWVMSSSLVSAPGCMSNKGEAYGLLYKSDMALVR